MTAHLLSASGAAHKRSSDACDFNPVCLILHQGILAIMINVPQASGAALMTT
ncbi:hypothetical protein Csa_013141 [Cucumis sativus]|nr:hypothetical protein Csa_013141 [Cucumis sativus]